MTRSIMEQAWLDTPHRARLTSWRPAHIARFLRQIGTDYDFLFTEHSANFVSNQWKHRPRPDWAVATVQAGQLLIRFVADRGAYEVLVSSPASFGQWFRLEHLCVLIQFYLDAARQRPERTRVARPLIPAFLRDRFAVFEVALSPTNIDGTAQDLARLLALLSTGELAALPERSRRSFRASDEKISEKIGRGPSRKTLRICALLVALLPLLPLLFFAEIFCELRTIEKAPLPNPRE
jgi:hypothetical protein